MIQFFAPDIATQPIMPESESQHAIRVLRLGHGDIIPVIDGKGNRYSCEIVDPHQKHTLVRILSCETIERYWRGDITVAVAPTKHIDRMEWLLEKLVEVGIDRFVPLLCSRSERKEIKTERLEKIAVSAMKQSLKAAMPVISPMTPIAGFVRETAAQQKFVGYCDDTVERRLLSRSAAPDISTVIMIGPEGDFSPAEVDMLLKNGYIPVTLGDCRLRTETAALDAVITLHTVNQLAQ